MKLRYLFVTFLTLGILLYGIVMLGLRVSEEMESPLAERAVPVIANEPAAPVKEKIIVIADTTATIESPATDMLSEVASQEETPVGDLYNVKKIREAGNKYTKVTPKEWGEEVTGMVSKVNVPKAKERVLFLTLNTYTKDYPDFFAYLKAKKIKSTIFLSGNWVRRNTARAKEIGASGNLFEIGNHGDRNKPLSAKGDSIYGFDGTQSLAAALADVSNGAEAIKQATGQTPRYVRPFVNYTDEVVVSALADAGVKTIGFSHTGDGGGAYTAEKVKNELLEAAHGDIILLSINPDYPQILEGLKAAIETIEKQKLLVRFERLAGFESYFDYLK